MCTPTTRQLRYLRTLAERTGQTFTPPHTTAEASAEIDRLLKAPATSRADRRREQTAIADAIQAGPVNAAARVREDEISGHGSTATWTQNRDQDDPPIVDDSPRRRRPQAGARTELGRYTAAGEERVLWGQRVDGVVRISDCAAARGGRSYLVERGLESNAELQGVVGAYLKQAEALDAIPMAHVPVELAS